MSINGDVLIKLAAGMQNSIEDETYDPTLDEIIRIRREIQQRKEGPPIDIPQDLHPVPDHPYDDPIIDEIPRPDIPDIDDDPRINNHPRPDYPPVNIPKGKRESKSVGVGRAVGHAARNVRDGAVGAAKEVGRSVSDIARGIGQGWRRGR